MVADPITDYVITPHAEFEAQRRGIDLDLVRKVLSSPEQREELGPGRSLLQSKYYPEGSEKVYLIRVIVDVDRKPAEVVTVYKTSKISKYWKESP